ncbi:MAG: hypothetical protein KDA41_13740, partial [Planctomycetales bacterium]|nr:hypothetical protein [Planctomycetales bacterium]
RRAGRELDALEVLGGAGGVAQRAFKGDLQNAAQAPAAGAAKFRAADRDEEVVVDTVKQVGAKTFFRHGQVWVDSTATAEQIKHVKKIERFSKEYFDLAARFGKDAARYLAMEGSVQLRLGDEVYEF